MVVAQQATFVGLGSFSDPQVQLAAFGLILTAILMARNVKGSDRYRNRGHGPRGNVARRLAVAHANFLPAASCRHVP